MDHFLFIFPHKDYVNIEWENWKDTMRRKVRGITPAYLNRIIEMRYRQRGCTVNWLVFGKEEDYSIPALDDVSPWLHIAAEDTVLCADITYKEFCDKEQCLAPGPFIRGLPKLERLVIGGFHQDSCVEKMAKAASVKAIDVHVDEDTTESFFKTTALYGRIPLRRTKPWPHAGCYEHPSTLDQVRAYRATRPWLTQV